MNNLVAIINGIFNKDRIFKIHAHILFPYGPESKSTYILGGSQYKDHWGCGTYRTRDRI